MGHTTKGGDLSLLSHHRNIISSPSRNCRLSLLSTPLVSLIPRSFPSAPPDAKSQPQASLPSDPPRTSLPILPAHPSPLHAASPRSRFSLRCSAFTKMRPLGCGGRQLQGFRSDKGGSSGGRIWLGSNVHESRAGQSVITESSGRVVRFF